jgi:hypothetical protein
MIRKHLLAGAAAGGLFIAFAAPSFAGDSQPAVSGLNGKLDLGGGQVERRSTGYVQGSVSAPLGETFAIQVDGIAGEWNSKSFEGGAVHLFTRDPKVGLVGLYYSYVKSSAKNTTSSFDGPDATGTPSSITQWGDLHVARYGVEFEGYHDRWTVTLRGGGESGLGKNRAWDRATLSYYPMDNLRLQIGHRYTISQSSGFLQGEYQIPGLSRLSLYAQVGGSQSNSLTSFAGLRFYFGGSDKTLILRHREDDPEAALQEDLFAIAKSIKHTNVCHWEGSVVPCGGAG